MGRNVKCAGGSMIVLCGLVVLGNLAVQRALADGPVPLAVYAGVVSRAEQLSGDAATQLDSTLRQALCRQAADALDGIRTVTFDSGESMTVDNQALIARLRQREPTQASARALQARLSALRDGLGVPAGRLDPADREKLRALLAQPPFSQPVVDDSLTRWIDELLARIFGGAARGAFNLGPAIVVIGVVLAVAVLVSFVFALRRTGASEAVLPRADASGEQAPTASEAFSGAQRYVAAGDYRSAVRLLYLGTLLRLDERGLLRFDRSLTNREYLRAVAAFPSIRDALRPVVETFDRTWYGFGPLSAGEFAQYQAQVEALRNAHLS
jgi:Domain of unknown function (DUF4129)